jgi:UDP-N-acetylglucosamine 2-epimerase (non-hydrolysing)
VAGARPNFVKISPIIRAIEDTWRQGKNINYRLVHTGQHYDPKMSGDFFEELRIPAPHINLGAGGGTQAEQTAAIMVAFERELLANRPTLVLVVGDVTSTMACTIVAKKLCIPVAHVEAGIRSGDMTMPEEINRIVTDAICDYYFTTSEEANIHLKRAGISDDRIHFVGNTMIDTLYQNLDRVTPPLIWSQKDLRPGKYFLITLHRPSNVDSKEKLKRILDIIVDHVSNLPVIFPAHPRTRKILESLQYHRSNLTTIDPCSYLEFIYHVNNSMGVITDSGGLSEETTVLNIPCMTLRDSTERPETVAYGTNVLIGPDPAKLIPSLEDLMTGKWKAAAIPPLWDGRSSVRIVNILVDLLK